MKWGTGVLAATLLAMGSGCAHQSAGLSAETQTRLTQTQGAYLTGATAGLGRASVLNKTDFIWGLDFSPRQRRVAYTRLGSRSYFLSIWSLESPPRLLADPTINPYEFDVEGVAFSPDGSLVATASRDGAVRVFDAATGEARGVRITEEPLSVVAFHPEGRWLVVGSVKGLITVLAVDGLVHASEERGHEGPVSALAFAPDGTLYSGGWDKHVRAWDARMEAVSSHEARTRFERASGSAVVSGSVNGKAMGSFALDARVPAIVVTSEVATAAGIDVASLKETVDVPGALGTTQARLARGQFLRFKSLVVRDVDVAVCDACVPQGLRGVLGAPFSQRVSVAFDEVHKEVRLTLTSGAPEGSAPVETLVLAARSDFTFPAYVSDVTVDARGQRLGVGLSEQKPERDRAVYERERQGFEEPQGPFNAGAVVDAATGKVLHKWPVHRGVVSTAAISPDGRSLISGGWDKQVHLFTEGESSARGTHSFDWAVRRVRFSPEGRWVGVAAWTPQVASSSGESDPSAVLLDVRYAEGATVVAPGAAAAQ
ncbi:WD domain-/G-beta repeat-containing protein [Myxococcus stipitatus DSM 14675]|uniref:WD domain-/G-beta repeat-containing protein n=1 Tax=Myxococcus stipitatus (strain DSM 14675 / JCM 12634 / Mx s8) TaxID=1278073 RepID=L7U6I1_MYXSD|nr:WD40 repeat domain-containing protein [Myxococcus stipitatus]AGC42079.1 WD domain-/G-beta repeat-containing protein [Myxococcus stipitatus DSM 14675]